MYQRNNCIFISIDISTYSKSIRRAFRSDPNISIRIGSNRGFWPYRKRSDRIEFFLGGQRSDRIGSDRNMPLPILDRIGSDRKLCFSGDSDREFLEFRPSK